MTTTMATERAQKRPRASTGTGRRSTEALVFSVATAVGLLHGLDDAFLHRQPGVGVGQHALAAALSLVLGLGAIYVFPTLRPALRSAVAFLFGALATVNGLLHVKHIADQGVAASDITGALVAAAGAVLIGLAIATPWLHRGERAISRRRRWTYRVLAVPIGLLAAFYVVVPMGIALTETHKYREPIGAPPSADYREVSFKATDGVELSGWYRPTRNGATILVVHGGGGDRTGAVAHAKLLVRHGYGVLLHDARGRGKSEGVQNAWVGAGTKTSPARSRTSRRAPRSTPHASARSGFPRAPTYWSRSPGSATTSRRSSPTERPPARSPMASASTASRQSRRSWASSSPPSAPHPAPGPGRCSKT